MERVNNKNKRLTIIVGALLLVVGISFAYFLATTLINGTGSSSSITTANINGATLTVQGTLEFTDTEVLPGHKNISAIKVTATGQNQTVAYNLIWNGTNSLNTPLNYTVYKSNTPVNTTANCDRKTSVVSGMQVLNEECNITNLDQLGSVISSGTINKSIEETKVTFSQDEMINATSSGTVVYYYVILEYPNLDEAQDSDMGGTFSGVVTVEASNAQADISIVGIYQEGEDGEYTKVNNIPSSTSNYVLNTERSSCTNNASPTWNESDWSLEVTNLNQSGTDCNLYFEKLPTSEDILGKLNITANSTIPDFSQIADTDEGVFKAEDGMYGGYSYYWRGAVTNNHVIFANLCWKIVRINGDGSTRLIYNGESNSGTCPGSIVEITQKYNVSYDRSEYVGYTFTEGSQRGTTTSSNLKTQTETWFNSKIIGTNREKVADGYFCNDRSTVSGSTWNSQGSAFYYAGYGRRNGNPTLDCTNASDKYTLKVGAITMDEVIMAGAKLGTANGSYYLCNGKTYWTMTPYDWSGSSARVFYVDNGGFLTANHVGYSAPGIRPVINLKSTVQFQPGSQGTSSSPYIVID